MGERFAGRYELIDPIGDGGMGTVWRVWDQRTQQVVAAKVLRQSDASSLLRFVRETAVRVAHPHVIAPLGWAGDDDRVLFTMPLVDGGSVSDLVAGAGPLPPGLVAELLRQLLDGLAAVHAAGVVHRDIKPGNLLLAATGSTRPHLYLGDFGIAVESTGPRLTTHDVVVGTPGYIAPELERGEDPSVASDLYAAGMVATVMLTGRRPARDGAAATLAAGGPALLSRLVTALTDVDPAARPASASEARAALDDPSVAWTPDVLGGLVLPSRLPPLPAGPWTAPEAHTLVPEGEAGRRPVATATGTSTPPTKGGPHRLGLLASVLVLVIGVTVMAVALTRGGDGDRGTSSATDPTASSSSTTTTPAPPPSSTSSRADPPTTGNYTVGTVVQREGQTCALHQEDERTTTIEGRVPVTCRWDPQEDGYTWQRED